MTVVVGSCEGAKESVERHGDGEFKPFFLVTDDVGQRRRKCVPGISMLEVQEALAGATPPPRHICQGTVPEYPVRRVCPCLYIALGSLLLLVRSKNSQTSTPSVVDHDNHLVI